ncbi:MAG: hypothetical protein FWG87_00245 [Defluviitaleaceae bacterium]|nr:hypothetical protein [Defluviitaleaceae bacterium]
MGGARIFVLHKKDMIKFGVIVLAGLTLLVAGLVLMLSGGSGGSSAARYNPGTYSSSIILNGEPLHIRVTVSENEILSIYMSDMAETQRVFYPLFEPQMQDLAQEILQHQSAHINPSTDYPVTTAILQEAVRSALELAHTEMYAGEH